MRSETYSIVQLMPSRAKLTARGLSIAFAIGAVIGTFAALWPKPGWLP